MADNIPAVVILGPTASGKTQLGIALALRFKGEIISCDALQVYRQMNIGTAKASPAEQQKIRHHMLDLRNPDEDFSAGEYQRLSREALRSIHQSGHIALVVGGTGLYLRAMIDGLFEGPAKSESLRRRMRRIIERKSSRTLHKALRRIDPQSAARIAETDGARIIRAYEVYLVSGKPMSWWQRQPRNALKGYRWLKLGIDVPRELLYSRIDRRVEEMFKIGLVEEVQELLAKFPRDSHAFKAIGYRQAADYVEGRVALGQAIADTKTESRRYAKRQLTWFGSDPDIIWLDGQAGSSELEKMAAAQIEIFLGNRAPLN